MKYLYSNGVVDELNKLSEETECKLYVSVIINSSYFRGMNQVHTGMRLLWKSYLQN